MDFPEFVLERTSKFPNSNYIVAGSTPIPFFGNFLSAESYTIGINPSFQEFQEQEGILFSNSKKRLEDYESLGLLQENNQAALSRESAQKVLNGCTTYFQKKPYKWFDQLEKFANKPLGSSYYDNSACHLDLVQWATLPIWSGIREENPEDARELMDSDLPFLFKQLEWLSVHNRNLKRFILSGRTVVTALEHSMFKKMEIIRTSVLGKKVQYELYKGSIEGIDAFGTSMNIPDSHTSNAHREFCADWIRTESSKS